KTLGLANLFMGKKPLALTGTAAVKADAPLGLDTNAQNGCTQGGLHVQQGIETPALELTPDRLHALEAGLLVEHHQLHPFEPRHQLRLNLAQHPGDRAVWPTRLDDMDQSQGVANIANGRKAQDTDGLHGGSEARGGHYAGLTC